MVTKNCSVKPSLNENPFRGTWDEIVGVPFVSLTGMKDRIYYFVSPAAAWDLNMSRLCRRRNGDENQCYAVLHWLDVDSKNAYTGGNMGGRNEAHPKEPEGNWRDSYSPAAPVSWAAGERALWRPNKWSTSASEIKFSPRAGTPRSAGFWSRIIDYDYGRFWIN